MTTTIDTLIYTAADELINQSIANPVSVQLDERERRLQISQLLNQLLDLYALNSYTHWQYVGKAMPDNVYTQWAHARDTTIPRLKLQLLDLARCPK